jgi:hypothetical protein
MSYAHKELMQGNVSDNYVGKYMMQLIRPPYMAVFPIEFVKRNGTLYIHSAYGADIRLVPETANKFFYANGTDQQIEFETDNTGNMLRVWQITWGIRKELKKVE